MPKMQTIYPTRNPFPYQGTLSIEGTSSRGEDTEVSSDPVTTLLLDPVVQTEKVVEKYLVRYGSRQPAGQAVILRGDHGAGKTHTIQHVRRKVAGGAFPAVSPTVAKPLQIYAKAEGPSFLALYQRIMTQVPIELLRRLTLEFIGVLTAEQLRQDASDPVAVEQAVETLRREPERVYGLFQKYVVEAGAVQQQQAEEVERIAGGVNDFKRALSYLLDVELSTAAYDWLLARSLDPTQARMLGVSGPIASDDVARWAVQLVATLFSRARKPLIIYIDQYEKLVLDPSGNPILSNAGLLHSLVEVLPREHTLLLLSGNEEAWQSLSRDLRQRFALNVISFPVLSFPNARSLIALYIRSALAAPYEQLAEGDGLDNAYPFSDEAIRAALRFSNGNPRRLLQICAAAFDRCSAEQAMIDGRDVEQALEPGSPVYFTRETVFDEVRRLLESRSLRVVEEYAVEGEQVDFAAFDADGNVQVLVEVSEAIFHHDEVRRAQRNLTLVERIRRAGVTAPIILVVIGYISPDVVREVRKVVQEMVVFGTEVFASRFAAAVDRLVSIARAGNAPVEVLQKQLNDVRRVLDGIRKSRDEELRTLEDRLLKLVEQQTQDRFLARWQNAREQWASERSRIEQRVTDAREARRRREIDELNRLRNSGERLSLSWLVARIAFVVLLMVFGGFLFWNVALSEPARWSLVVFVGIGGILLIGWWLYEEFTGPGWDLRGPVESVEELEFMARPIARRDGTSRRYSARGMLLHRNPHVRFAGALAVDPRLAKRLLLNVLERERSTIVRRVICSRLGGSTERPPEELFPLFGSMPEVVYAFEHYLLRNSDADLLVAEGYPLPIRLLAVIYGFRVQREKRDGLAIRLAASVYADEPPDDLTRELVKAFGGLDRKVLPELRWVSADDAREALAALSPVHEDGLGRFDDLRHLDRVDRLYIFFQQLLFLIERDVIAPPTNEQESREVAVSVLA